MNKYQVMAVDKITGAESVRTVTADSEDAARNSVNDAGFMAGNAVLVDTLNISSPNPRHSRIPLIALAATLLVIVAVESALRANGKSILNLVSSDARELSRIKKHDQDVKAFSDSILDLHNWLLSPEGENAAWIAATKLAQKELKSPRTAIFPDLIDLRLKDSQGLVWNEKKDSFIIIAYVDSQNSFGALIRTNFSTEIHPLFRYVPDDPSDIDHWKVLSLNFYSD